MLVASKESDSPRRLNLRHRHSRTIIALQLLLVPEMRKRFA